MLSSTHPALGSTSTRLTHLLPAGVALEAVDLRNQSVGGSPAPMPSSPSQLDNKSAAIPHACSFCKSRHLKCDGATPQCVQCSLRKQDCVYNSPPRKRGRKSRTSDVAPYPKRTKIIETDTSPQQYWNNDPSPTEEFGKKGSSLISSSNLATLRLIERGDTSSLRMEDVISLVLNQQQKIAASKSRIRTGNVDGLTDLVDFSQDKEVDTSPFVDIPISDNYNDELSFGNALVQAFSIRNDMYYPNAAAPVDSNLAHEYLRKFNSANDFRQLLKSPNSSDLAEAYCYGIFLSFAASIMMRWNLGYEYSGRSDMIARTLMKKQVSLNPALVTKMLSCIGYQIVFHLGRGDFAEARTHILQQYNFFNSCRSTTPVAIVHNLYSNMSGMTGSTEDRLHWIKSTEMLPTAASSPLNEAVRAVVTTGEVFARDEPLLDLRTILQKSTDDEYLVRSKLYDAIEAIVPKIETFPNYVFARQQPFYATLHHIFNGTKSLLALMLGKHEEALTYAFTTIQSMRNLDPNILGTFQLYSNAYAIQTAIALFQRDLYRTGLELLKVHASSFPVGVKIIERLVEQTALAEMEFGRYTTTATPQTSQHFLNPAVTHHTFPTSVIPGMIDSSHYPTGIPGLGLMTDFGVARGHKDPLANHADTAGWLNPQMWRMNALQTISNSNSVSTSHNHSTTSRGFQS